MIKKSKISTDEELEILQAEAFNYFLHQANPNNGLIMDKTAHHWPASIAATGLALACYPVGVERGWMSRQAAIARVLATLRFFWNSSQGIEPDATGYKGFYYHFLDMKTGRRAWQCELSTIDTAFLIAGVLTTARYFQDDNVEEREIRLLADQLYQRVDWTWVENKGDTLTHGWKPETGFIPYRWKGYDEAQLLYVLALGSPTYPLPLSSYQARIANYQWESHYGFEYLYSGPLFTHQLSHIWIDFRDIQDSYMQEKNCNYFENSRRATYIQQAYAMANPNQYVGYSDTCWGITVSDGPGPDVRLVAGIERQFYDYIGRGVPYGPDDGTVAPWAALTSLPFAPEIVLPVIDHFCHTLKLRENHLYGFRATFNQSHPDKNHPCGWVSPYYFGLNIGPIVLMFENFRTGFIWNLMRECPYIINVLKRAGFRGGWLSNH
jgi:hypothetical protein